MNESYKKSFIEFVSNSSPEELNKFISEKGKKSKMKKIMVRIKK